MCRMMVYKGAVCLMEDLLTRPEHSIVKQSYASKERLTGYVTPGSLNGDGFGVGWYLPDTSEDRTPGVFTSVTPAWSSMNLAKLSAKIYSPLIFAHVRAASAPPVSEINCHPFVNGRYMFMHNGHIDHFRSIKRSLEATLSDTFYTSISGTTDSELAFALYLSTLEKHVPGFTVDMTVSPLVMALALDDLIDILDEATLTEEDPGRYSMLNFVITDGCTVVASKYVASLRNVKCASLYYTSGSGLELQNDALAIRRTARRECMAMICSEPLTDRREWVKVPDGSIVTLTPDNVVHVRPVRERAPRIARMQANVQGASAAVGK